MKSVSLLPILFLALLWLAPAEAQTRLDDYRLRMAYHLKFASSESQEVDLDKDTLWRFALDDHLMLISAYYQELPLRIEKLARRGPNNYHLTVSLAAVAAAENRPMLEADRFLIVLDFDRSGRMRTFCPDHEKLLAAWSNYAYFKQSAPLKEALARIARGSILNMLPVN